jgi:hypothetical protein
LPQFFVPTSRWTRPNGSTWLQQLDNSVKLNSEIVPCLVCHNQQNLFREVERDCWWPRPDGVVFAILKRRIHFNSYPDRERADQSAHSRAAKVATREFLRVMAPMRGQNWSPADRLISSRGMRVRYEI